MVDNKSLVLSSPKQRQGRHYERQACRYLQAKGLVLIAQNWHQPKVGELDLVMIEKGIAWSTLVFIEVRQRRLSGFGDAALSITTAKQHKIIKTAKYFLQQYPQYANYDCRFDVIAYNIKKQSTEKSTSNLESQQDCDEKSEQSVPPEWLVGAFVAKAW